MKKFRNWMLAVLSIVSFALGSVVATAPLATALSTGQCTTNITSGSVTSYCPNFISVNGVTVTVLHYNAYARCVNYFTRAPRAVYGPTVSANSYSTAACAWYEGVSSGITYVVYYI